MDLFAECNEKSTQNLIEKSKNTNTTKATSQWMRVYQSWAKSRGTTFEIVTSR